MVEDRLGHLSQLGFNSVSERWKAEPSTAQKLLLQSGGKQQGGGPAEFLLGRTSTILFMSIEDR